MQLYPVLETSGKNKCHFLPHNFSDEIDCGDGKSYREDKILLFSSGIQLGRHLSDQQKQQQQKGES